MPSLQHGRALIPALGGRGRQISEFEASLVYRVSARTTRTVNTEETGLNSKQTIQNNVPAFLCGADLES